MTSQTFKYRQLRWWLLVFITLTWQTANAVEYEGVLAWSKRVELSTPVSGVVQKVFAVPGQVVAKGDTLVQLDPRGFQADLKQAAARVKSSNDQRLEMQRELERQTEMYNRTMLSEHELQVAKNNLVAAEAAWETAQALHTKAKLKLEYSAIRAPFNAIVVSVHATEGQTVSAELTPPALVVVAEAQRMLVRFYATNAVIKGLAKGQGVNVQINADSYQGSIHTVSLEPDVSSNTYAVDVQFDSGKILLRAGQKAKVSW